MVASPVSRSEPGQGFGPVSWPFLQGMLHEVLTALHVAGLLPQSQHFAVLSVGPEYEGMVAAWGLVSVPGHYGCCILDLTSPVRFWLCVHVLQHRLLHQSALGPGCIGAAMVRWGM